MCYTKIKVQCYAFEKKVRIEWFKDLPDYSHSLKESEKLKRSNAIRDLIIQKASKNYRPPEILNAVKEYATDNLNLGESVKELRQMEVMNIKYKVCRSLDAHFIGNPKWGSDIQNAISFLKEQEYLVEFYEVSHLSTYGFIFIHPN